MLQDANCNDFGFMCVLFDFGIHNLPTSYLANKIDHFDNFLAYKSKFITLC